MNANTARGNARAFAFAFAFAFIHSRARDRSHPRSPPPPSRASTIPSSRASTIPRIIPHIVPLIASSSSNPSSSRTVNRMKSVCSPKSRLSPSSSCRCRIFTVHFSRSADSMMPGILRVISVRTASDIWSAFMATRVVDDAIRDDVWRARIRGVVPLLSGSGRLGAGRARRARVKNERMKQFSKIQVRITRGAHKKYGAGSRAEGFVRARVLGVDDDGAALPRNVSEVDGLAEFEIVDDVASTRLKRGDLNAG